MNNRTRLQLQNADADARSALLDQLATTAAAGSHEAAADLAWAVRTFRLAHPAIRQYLISEHDVSAAEGAVMVAVALRIDSFRAESKFTTWLHRVASNEAKMLIRGEARHSDRAEAGDSVDFAEDFVARVSSMVVDRAVIREEIEQLPEDRRQALLLREDDGLTYEEIATRLDVPLSTAKTWVRRARLELAERLSERLGHRDPA